MLLFSFFQLLIYPVYNDKFLSSFILYKIILRIMKWKQ